MTDYGSPRAAMTCVLRQIAVGGLFADVVLLVVAMAFCGVERRGRRAAGALVALVVVGNGLDGFCHCWSPLSTERKRRRDGGRSSGELVARMSQRVARTRAPLTGSAT